MTQNLNHKAGSATEETSHIALLVGEEVLNLISNDRFKQEWDELYQQCEWATAFQSRGFVTTWYNVFRGDYLPLLVKSEHEGKISGLLTMAIPISGSTIPDFEKESINIVGAGEYEAEYQCWIASHTYGEQFIKSALSEMMKCFPKANILFRFIPPLAPLNWSVSDPEWKSMCVVQSHKRPLLNLRDPNATKAFKITKQFKTKYNRLKRLGEVRFEKLSDINEFTEALKELTLQFDFRQGCMFNKNQFRDKPQKFKLMVELFKQGLLHATILKVDEEIIASMVAVAGKNWVHLQGINTHSPFYAKHSPGILHFLHLGQSLAQEGVEVFDLTPGGDEYKERFATTHDNAYTLIVTPNTAFRLKKYIKRKLHIRLIKAGKRPMTFELAIEKRKYLLRSALKSGVKTLLKEQLSNIIDSQKPVSKFRLVKPANTTTAMAIQRDNLNDLLCYTSAKGELSRWEFMEDAMQRFESGAHSYTWVEDDCLMACAWIGGANTSKAKENFKESDGVAALHHIYCYPAAKGKLHAFLITVISQAAKDIADKQLIAYCEADDKATLRSIKEAGFTDAQV